MSKMSTYIKELNNHFPFNIFAQSIKEKKDTKLVLGGSQEGKIGPTHYETMNQTFNKISEKASPGVSFNVNRLVSYLNGGTCSAMTFGFARDLIKSPIKDLHERIVTVMKNYTKSCAAFRAEQIAFNSIEKDTSTPTEDFKRAKVQSLANYYELELDSASEEFTVDSIVKNPELFNQTIEILPEGLYIVRILNPSNNFKEERWGHTTLYVKNKIEGDYFYDPNYGLTEIATGGTGAFLKNHFQELESDWFITLPRFYRIKV